MSSSKPFPSWSSPMTWSAHLSAINQTLIRSVLAFASLSQQVSKIMVASDLVRSTHDMTDQCSILMLTLSFDYTCLKAEDQQQHLPNKRTTHFLYACEHTGTLVCLHKCQISRNVLKPNYSWVSLCSEVKGMSLFNLSPSDMSFFLSSLPRASSSFSTLSSSFLTLCSVVPGISDSKPAVDAMIKSLNYRCHNECMSQRSA